VHNLQINEQVFKYKNALQVSELLQPYFKPSEGISCTSLRRGVFTRFAVDFFPYELLNARKQKKYYRQATYEDEISMFPQPNAVLVFQEIDCLNAIITTRSAYT
jgi:hypothetical protein